MKNSNSEFFRITLHIMDLGGKTMYPATSARRARYVRQRTTFTCRKRANNAMPANTAMPMFRISCVTEIYRWKYGESELIL